MMNSMLTVLTNFVNIYLIRRFVNVFLDGAKPDKKKEIIVCGTFFVISTGAYLVFHLVYINVICTIAGISALVLLRTKSVKTYFLVTYSVYAVNLICDVIVIPLFVDYTDGQGFNQIFFIIEVFLIWMCEQVTERIVRHRRQEDGAQGVPLILVPLVSVIVLLILMRIDDREALLIVGVSLLIINFLVFYLYDIVVQNANARYENALLRQQAEMYGNQISIIMQDENKINSLRHDMKHHLNELQYMIDKKGKQDALQYIDSMRNYLQNPDEIVKSGNVEMDSLLNYMLRKAENSLTTVKAEVSIPENILPAFDINVILGNLLENAIEAAEQSEEKSLEMRIYYRQGVVTIEMKNSFAGELRRTGEGFLTTKTEEGSHGIGLTSVKGIVEKYDGSLETETEGNIFRVNVVLYLSQF